MTQLEIIDHLCAVTETQSRIIRELYTFIDEQLTVDEEIKKKFAEKCRTVDAEAALVESGLPLYISHSRKKEFDK